MANCEKLFQKAKNSTKNFHFSEICKLAVCYEFNFVRQKGSHHIYIHPTLPRGLGGHQTFQDRNGKAVPYQVEQLLSAIENLGE